MVERRVSEKKVADSRFDSRTGNVSVCGWREPLRVFLIGAKQSTHHGYPFIAKDMQKRVLYVRAVRQTQSACFIHEIRNEQRYIIRIRM